VDILQFFILRTIQIFKLLDDQVMIRRLNRITQDVLDNLKSLVDGMLD